MPKEEIGLETSKKQTMTQGEFLLPFAPACPPRHSTQEPRTSPGDYYPSVADSLKAGERGAQNSLRKGGTGS